MKPHNGGVTPEQAAAWSPGHRALEELAWQARGKLVADKCAHVVDIVNPHAWAHASAEQRLAMLQAVENAFATEEHRAPLQVRLFTQEELAKHAALGFLVAGQAQGEYFPDMAICLHPEVLERNALSGNPLLAMQVFLHEEHHVEQMHADVTEGEHHRRDMSPDDVVAYSSSIRKERSDWSNNQWKQETYSSYAHEVAADYEAVAATLGVMNGWNARHGNVNLDLHVTDEWYVRFDLWHTSDGAALLQALRHAHDATTRVAVNMPPTVWEEQLAQLPMRTTIAKCEWPTADAAEIPTEIERLATYRETVFRATSYRDERLLVAGNTFVQILRIQPFQTREANWKAACGMLEADLRAALGAEPKPALRVDHEMSLQALKCPSGENIARLITRATGFSAREKSRVLEFTHHRSQAEEARTPTVHRRLGLER